MTEVHKQIKAEPLDMQRKVAGTERRATPEEQLDVRKTFLSERTNLLCPRLQTVGELDEHAPRPRLAQMPRKLLQLQVITHCDQPPVRP